MLYGVKANQTQKQSLANLSAVLEAAGSSIDNCVMVKVFLTNMEDFASMNKVYADVFSAEPKPVRTWYVSFIPCLVFEESSDKSSVAVHQLPLGTDVEIECIAHL